MKRKLPNVLKGNTIDRLLRATETERDRLVLMLALYAGLRCREITRLRAEDVDFEGKILFIRKSKMGGERTVPIMFKLVGPLKAWLHGRQTGPCFPSRKGGGHLTTRALQHMIKRVAKRAGIPGWNAPRVVHMHGLRHAFATIALRAGCDIRELQDLLGHADLSSSMIYTHVDGERLREAVDRPYS